MYRIFNTEKAFSHYKDYADRVWHSVNQYLNDNMAVLNNSYTKEFLNQIIQSDPSRNDTGSLLEIILMGNYQQQKALIAGVDFKLRSQDEKDLFYKTTKEVFVEGFYENKKFFDKNRIEVCPYCGRSYIMTAPHPTITNPNTIIKSHIDHFLPKDTYPYLSINYFNLIPCCPTCNLSPCKWDHDPIGEDRTHEYLMQPYEFRKEEIVFNYIPTTRFYKDFSVKVSMRVNKEELKEGYNKWLALDKLYEKHNGIVTGMYEQLESIVSVSYSSYLKDKFKLPGDFLKKVPLILCGKQLDDEKAPYVIHHKFKKDICAQIMDDLKHY